MLLSKLNTWAHVAGVYDSTHMRLYVNGLLAEKREFSGQMASNDVPVSISMNNVGQREATKGFIDRVRIGNVARSEAEIQAKMDSRRTGNEPGLAGYWNFDDGTLRDLPPNGNDGQLMGNDMIVGSDLPL